MLDIKSSLVDWKFYYKLFFGLLTLLFVFAPWLNDLINGYSINPELVKKEHWSQDAVDNYLRDKGDYTFNYFSYFTTQTNIFVGLWFLLAAIFHNKEGKVKLLSYNVTLAVTVYISITFIVWNALLLPFDVPHGAWNWIRNAVVHILSPLAMIAYFIFWYEKKQIYHFNPYWRKTGYKFYFYPIGWAIFNMIRGEFRYQAGKVFPYQYFFMNIHKESSNISGAVWLVIAIIFVSLLVFGLTTGYNASNNYFYKKNRIIRKTY